jgi:deazaflavin-dependent oxidoreductase (nitroreductase family)
MDATPPPAWMVRLNVGLLRRGLAIGSQHLLTVTGRRSGEPRSTPVSIAVLDGDRYIVAAFGDAAWVRNVRAARAGTLLRRGRTESVRLDELPISHRAPVLLAFFEQVRGGRRFFGGQTIDEVVRNADRYPVFRVSSA